MLEQKYSPLKYRDRLGLSWFYGSIMRAQYWECKHCTKKFISPLQFGESFQKDISTKQIFLDRLHVQTEDDPANEVVVAAWLTQY